MASKRTLEAFSSPSSHTSQRRPWKYDVFLSFRGKDTRKNFTDHLYHALKDAGIDTYRDDNELPRGKEISIELLDAIQGSKISLIVFSRNYAGSRWCLDELVHIMDCQATVRQMVLPIFYNVNPSEVRKQMGSFGEAFSKLGERFKADMDKVSRWRKALTKAGALSGWDSANWYEATLIKKIVKEILNHLNNTYLKVAKYPIGIDSRVQHMNELLGDGLNDVRIIGICAMGGMGKTTIAKAFFNQLPYTFKDRSFIENVREISKQPNGQVRIQEQLLYDILKMKKIEVSNVDRGINVIKERLSNRRVLIIFDDVDESGQLKAIAGCRDWLGVGSRIIITTRDKHLLKEIEVENIYTLNGLNCSESLKLFSWHAFKKSHPTEDYIEFSNIVVDYCEGLALALEVLGSFLFGRSIAEWKSALEKLKRTPPDQIQKKLRISFDALEDNKEKDIFLDIACFFIGVDKDYAVKILDGCGFFAEIGISVLIQRCLLKIDDNKLRMHDLLRDMGREIVREESPKEPGNCSRLWFYDDVLNILTEHTGTKAIEGLILQLPTLNKVCLSTKAFANMRKLRLLQLNYLHHIEGYDHIFKELRLLCWHGFPLKSIPKSFHVENLVAIDMQYSKLKQVWKDIKFVGKLKILNLSHSHSLTKTPDFLQLPNLEKLILEDCTSLVEVHPSIGHLDRLLLLNLRDCKHLKNLSNSICVLRSLEILDLSGCLKFEKLPEDLGEMEALLELLLDNTGVRQVPFSIVRLKNLRTLSLCGCKGSLSSTLGSVFKSWLSSSSLLASIFRSWVSPRTSLDSISLLPASLQGLSSLKSLRLKDCNLSNKAFLNDLGRLSSLTSLELQSNNFCSLPASFSNLDALRFLRLDHCTSLESLPELPTSLKYLYAPGCISLKRLSNLSNFQCTPELNLTNCYKLVEIPGLGKSQTIGNILMVGCNNLAHSFKESLLQQSVISQLVNYNILLLPGNEIPQWFSHQCTGLSLSFRLPAMLGCKIKGIALCAIYESNTDINEQSISGFLIDVNRNKITINVNDNHATYRIPIPSQDHIWASHICIDDFCELYDGDHGEVEVTMRGKSNVKKFGIQLLYYDAERSTQSDCRQWIPCNSVSNQDAIVVGDDEDVFEDQSGSKGLKRGRDNDDADDDEAGLSHGWSDEDHHPKRLRYQVDSCDNTTSVNDP